jgi:hypothetical protein
MSLFVFKGHQRIAEFPDHFIHAITDNGALVIRDERGKEVQRFQDGEWHNCGLNSVCGYVDDDPDCPSCHP